MQMKNTTTHRIVSYLLVVLFVGYVSGSCVHLSENIEYHQLPHSYQGRDFLLALKNVGSYPSSGWIAVGFSRSSVVNSTLDNLQLFITTLPANSRDYSPMFTDVIPSLGVNEMNLTLWPNKKYRNRVYRECSGFIGVSCLFSFSAEQLNTFHRNVTSLVVMINLSQKDYGTPTRFAQPDKIYIYQFQNGQEPSSKCVNGNVTTSNFSTAFRRHRAIYMKFGIVMSSITTCALLIQLTLLILYRNRMRVKHRFHLGLICCSLYLIGKCCRIAGYSTHLGLLQISKKEFYFGDYYRPAGFHALLALAFVGYLSPPCAAIVYICHSVRYIIVKNLYIITQHQFRLLNRTNDSLLKLNRKLTSKSTMFLVVAISITLTGVGVGLSTWLSNDHVYDKLFTTKNLLTLAHMASIVVAIFALLLDIILQSKAIRSHITNYGLTNGLRRYIYYHFHFSDPLLIRIEIFIASILGVCMATIAIAMIVVTRKTTNVRLGDVCEILFYCSVQVFDLINPWILYWGGLVVVNEMRVSFDKSTRIRKRNKSIDDLETILQDPIAQQLFFQFTSQELSAENFLLWEQITPSRDAGRITVAEARKIYNTFVSDGSVMQVNLSNSIRHKLHEFMMFCDKLSETYVVSFKDNFEPLYKEIIVNLSDTFVRLSATREYQEYVREKNVQEAIMIEDQYYPTTDDSVVTTDYVKIN